MEATTQYFGKRFLIRISSPFLIFMPDIWASKPLVPTPHPAPGTEIKKREGQHLKTDLAEAFTVIGVQ
jgi:hypothetical protein